MESEASSELPRISLTIQACPSTYWFRSAVQKARLAPRNVHMKMEETSIDCSIVDRRCGFLELAR